MVRVRIAPSPTGFIHVGNAYVSLFNFAFAKKHNGKFVLRIEDTDIKRQVPKAEAAIYDGLSWLGLSWDEGPKKGGEYGPYRQSERLDIYKKYADGLTKNKLAYKDEGAVRFKNPGEDVSWKDEIRGEVSFPGGEITDFVLIKSNGFPTYNFAVAIDDIKMRISHVIRGEEHISNTPRQIAIYKALEKKHPVFAHLPTLRNKDRKKLSKRRDPVDLRLFRKQGYLPEALTNFLSLLGWSHPEGKELFSLDEFVKLFSLKRVRKAGPIFNLEKLDWLNGEYIRKTQDTRLKTQIFEFFNRKYSEQKISEVVPLVKDRITKFSDIESIAGFLLKKERPVPLAVTPKYSSHVSNVTISRLEAIDKNDWNLANINNAFGTAIQDLNAKVGDYYMDIRGTVSGTKVTPPINESIKILGKDETIARLKEGQKRYSK